VPNSWSKFALGLHQDFEILESDIDTYTKSFCTSVSTPEKAELRMFLNQLLKIGISGGRHKRYFRDYGAAFVPQKPEELYEKMLSNLN